MHRGKPAGVLYFLYILSLVKVYLSCQLKYCINTCISALSHRILTVFYMTFRILSVSDDLMQICMYWCSILIGKKGKLWQVIKCRGNTKHLLVFPDALYLVSLSCWRWLSCLFIKSSDTDSILNVIWNLLLFTTLSIYQNTPEFTLGFYWGSCYSIFSFMCMFCPFVYFLLAIVLSVLLRYTDSDYPFVIFKLLLDHNYE
jgi:hypothetical protein